MDRLIIPLNPHAPYGKAFTDRQRLSVIAAAVSMRWGKTAFKKSFGINTRTMVTMRNGRHRRYAYAHRLIKQLGKEQFIERYLLPETVERLEATSRLMGV